MRLQEKLEQSSEFLFLKSRDIAKEPDICGLKSSDPKVTAEAFQELLSKTEKGFVRISFYVMGNSLRLSVLDIKNNHLVTINNLHIAEDELTELRIAHNNHPSFSMGFGIFVTLNNQLQLYPISEQEMVLSIKSWELIDFQSGLK